MKKFLFFFLFVSTSLCAQRLKYKELFPLMESMSNQELKNSLKEYLSEDLDHPNANFRLALVYEKNYKYTDGLTNFEYVIANAEQAKLRFLKSKQVVDEREVNRNNEYYFAVYKMVDDKGKPNVPFSIVSKKIKDGYDSADIFVKKMPPIYKSFTKSVNFYDKAVKIFADINSRFSSLDDLYLYFDSDLDQQMETLKASYDSAKFYLDNYLSLIKAYPIARHKQQYVVKPVNTYRLDGLVTTLDFLTDKIAIWDYTTWVTQVRGKVHTSISSLRNNLNQIEEKLDNSLSKIEGSETVTPVKLDKQLIFNLNNFDKQSLALALLDYKSFKQGWLLQSNVFKPDTVFSDHNAEVYSSLIYANRNADTLSKDVALRINAEKIGKHKDFFTKYYGNIDGVKNYHKKEQEFIDKTFQDYSSKLRAQVNGLVNREVAATVGKQIRFGNRTISLQVTPLAREVLNKGEAITLQNKKSPDGSVFLSGVFKSDKKTKFYSAFLARIAPDGKPSWIKNFEYRKDSLAKITDANNFPAAVELTREGCAVLVRTSDTLKTYQLNTFVFYNDKGEEKIKHKLKVDTYPRKLTYLEKTNSFVMVLKGYEEKNNYGATEGMTIISLNALGDIQWSRNIELMGAFTDLINLTNGNLVVGNFMIVKDANGREQRTQVTAKETKPCLVLISDKGDIVKVQSVEVPRSVVIAKVAKVNDSSIHLMGSEGTYESLENVLFSPTDKTVHIMVNKICQKIFSSL